MISEQMPIESIGHRRVEAGSKCHAVAMLFVDNGQRGQLERGLDLYQHLAIVWGWVVQIVCVGTDQHPKMGRAVKNDY